MKRRLLQPLLLGVILLAIVPFTSYSLAGAQTTVSDEAHLEKIRQNCVAAQGSMQRVRQSDVATRINFGRAYDSLTTQLITPFNTRAVTHQSSSAPLLTEQTTALTIKVEAFRDDYVEYIDALNRAINMNCQDRPADFYTATEQAHDLREQLANDVKELKKITGDYRKTVESIAKTLEGNTESAQ